MSSAIITFLILFRLSFNNALNFEAIIGTTAKIIVNRTTSQTIKNRLSRNLSNFAALLADFP